MSDGKPQCWSGDRMRKEEIQICIFRSQFISPRGLVIHIRNLTIIKLQTYRNHYFLSFCIILPPSVPHFSQTSLGRMTKGKLSTALLLLVLVCAVSGMCFICIYITATLLFTFFSIFSYYSTKCGLLLKLSADE